MPREFSIQKLDSSTSEIKLRKIISLSELQSTIDAKEKLAVADTENTSTNTILARYFRNGKFVSLKCSECNSHLLNERIDDISWKIYDLPSDDWLELRECWVCHEDQFKEFTRKNIEAQLGSCLIGNMHYLMCLEDINENKIDRLPKTTEMAPQLIECRECNHLLGSLQDGNQVHFFKYATSCVKFSDGKNTIISPPAFPSFAAHELLLRSRSNASFKFYFQSYESQKSIVNGKRPPPRLMVGKKNLYSCCLYYR